MLENRDTSLDHEEKSRHVEEDRSEKLLSLIVFAQRVSSGLRQLLRSIDDQVYPHFEVILVLPIERNFLREWIAKLALKQKIHWHQLHTESIAEAYNRASTHAKGKFLLLLSDQDRLLGGHALERVAASIEEADIISSSARSLRVQDGKSFLVDPRFYQERFRRAYAPFFLSATVIRRSFFSGLGGFHPMMNELYYDLEFWGRALRRCPSIAFSEYVLIEHLRSAHIDSALGFMRWSCFLSILSKTLRRQGLLPTCRLLVRTLRCALRFLFLGRQDTRY